MDSRKKKWIGARMGRIVVLILVVGATNAATVVTTPLQTRKADIENDGARNSSDTDIQFNRGMAYFEGKGVAQDYVEAAKWLRLAADQGNAKAQFNLGLMYSKGQGVAQNYAEAVNIGSNRPGCDISVHPPCPNQR